MTDGIFGEAVKQVPSLVIFGASLGGIVIHFLKHLQKRDSILKDISKTCHDAQQRGNEAHDRSTEAVAENSKALGQVAECLRETGAILRTLNGKKH